MNELTEGTALTCAQCGAPVSAMHRQAGYRLTRCRRCSALLQINSERTATKVMTIETPGIICPLCTHVNPESQPPAPQQYCNNCAAALKKPCRACGQPVALIDNFCGRCRADQTGAAGAVFERPAAPVPPMPNFGFPTGNPYPMGMPPILPPNVPIYPSQPQLPAQSSRVVYNPALGLGPQVYNGNATPATVNTNPMQAQALTFVQSSQANNAIAPIDDSATNAIVESKRQKTGHAAIAAGTVSGVIALLNVGSYGYGYYGYYSAAYGAHAFWNVVAAGFLFLTVCLMTYRARLGGQQEQRGIKVYDSQDAHHITTINGGGNKLATRPFQTPMGLTVSFLGGMGLVIGMMTGGLGGVISWGMAELFLGGGFLVFAFIASWILKQLGLND